MFHMSVMSPDEIQGEIRVKSMLNLCLGSFTDVDGRRWHIRGIIGDYVQAVPLGEVHDSYTSTATPSQGFGTTMDNGGYVSQTWRPYRIIIVD